MASKDTTLPGDRGRAAAPRAPAPGASESPRQIVRDPARLQEALAKRMNRKVRIKGEMVVPCLPALADTYVRRLDITFGTQGKPFTATEMADLRRQMLPLLERGYADSSLSRLKIWWWSDDENELAVNWRMQVLARTKIEQYEHWVKSRKPPLFGAHPDARVMDLAATLRRPARIADLGAGTGRNAIPLAKAGHRVDAQDGTPSFVDIILRDAKVAQVSERLSATLGDLLSSEDPFPAGAYQMVLLSEVVPDLRRLADLQRIFRRADRLLAPGGLLLFNAFVADEGYEPDDVVRQLSQLHWSWILTRAELESARSGAPLVLESDERVYDYEKARLPAWPPTGWYSGWARCQDVFTLGNGEDPPVSLRWLTYRKRA